MSALAWCGTTASTNHKDAAGHNVSRGLPSSRALHFTAMGSASGGGGGQPLVPPVAAGQRASLALMLWRKSEDLVTLRALAKQLNRVEMPMVSEKCNEWRVVMQYTLLCTPAPATTTTTTTAFITGCSFCMLPCVLRLRCIRLSIRLSQPLTCQTPSSKPLTPCSCAACSGPCAGAAGDVWYCSGLPTARCATWRSASTSEAATNSCSLPHAAYP
jgi:hypothetical protein